MSSLQETRPSFISEGGTDYFTDKLSAELRVAIYTFLSSDSAYAKRSHERSNKQSVTAILATNRKLYTEAVDTFYKTEILRLSVEQLRDCLKCQDFRTQARHVQIVELRRDVAHARLHASLSDLLSLPQIKKVEMLSDSLAAPTAGSTSELAYHYPATVREVVSRWRLGQVTCVDIGRYQLNGDFASVEIIHSGIMRLWPHVASTPEAYDALQETKRIRDEWQLGGSATNVAGWIGRTSLRLWVGLLQVYWDRFQGKVSLSAEDYQMMNHFVLT